MRDDGGGDQKNAQNCVTSFMDDLLASFLQILHGSDFSVNIKIIYKFKKCKKRHK
jgi:hypothetical protein